MKKLIKQAFNFFVVSGIGWIVDMAIYTVLVSVGLQVVLSNIISAGLAASYVYLVSTKKIFVNGGKYSLKVKYVAYIIYQFCLIFVSSYVILFISRFLIDIFELYDWNFLLENVKIIAKIVNTPITMLINFVIMKCLIEKI